jgi:hypothetical protein
VRERMDDANGGRRRGRARGWIGWRHSKRGERREQVPYPFMLLCRDLELDGELERPGMLPASMSALTQLTRLKIACPLSCEMFSPILDLPKLENLEIANKKPEDDDLEGSAFPSVPSSSAR